MFQNVVLSYRNSDVVFYSAVTGMYYVACPVSLSWQAAFLLLMVGG